MQIYYFKGTKEDWNFWDFAIRTKSHCRQDVAEIN